MDSGDEIAVADEADAVLWGRCLDGDGEAMAMLFDRHERRLFRAALRDASTVHDAEDIVSTVFLELWRSRARVRVVDGSLLPWLLVTCANVSRNVARSRRRYRTLLAKLPPDEHEPDPADGALDAIEALQRDRRVAAALRELRPADRQILVLSAVEGLSLAECASALGIGHDAAKARLTRARRRAKSLLTESMGDPFVAVRMEETRA
ncbi:sigma-70 family RNA polymerase sigma factor [Herbiconiux moechotypicola]|uniref:RNA polymerase sigma factor n=1 Tax=Herbiconiux moechotypicola TaxID=637393 RepID=A0ABN3E4G0_9MICO|nr:sigma-70 family RNA polymerase sigma factor [Herbiconiux moechotypicola]MCS5731820.1 sigma-70 family RNA polymerase sigma factor [Herbiconiux moechotypicola]